MTSEAGKKFFLIAGEASGDVLGARLMRALKARIPGAEFSGIGGPLMEAEGMESLLPMSELCVMGIWEVIGHLPRLIKLIDGVTVEIERFDPDALITIDLPDFNFAVAQRLKKRGKCKAKRIHYVAPSVWAWRPGRAKKIAKFLDGLICLFPFEPPYFTKHGLKTEFVGHSLIEDNSGVGDGHAFRKLNGIPPFAKTLGLFFGSRQAEFEKMGEILRNSAVIVRERYPDLHIIVPTLPNLEFDALTMMAGFNAPVFIVAKPEYKWDSFAACDVAVAVSGTVGLELAYMGVPHVIAYKTSPATWAAMKLMVKVKYAHLANILLNAPIIPEFLQWNCTPLKIGRKLLRLYEMTAERSDQVEKTQGLRELLGASLPGTPSGRAADFVISIIV